MEPPNTDGLPRAFRFCSHANASIVATQSTRKDCDEWGLLGGRLGVSWTSGVGSGGRARRAEVRSVVVRRAVVWA